MAVAFSQAFTYALVTYIHCLILFNGEETEAPSASLNVQAPISVHFSHPGKILCTLNLNPLSMSVSTEKGSNIYTDRSNRE